MPIFPTNFNIIYSNIGHFSSVWKLLYCSMFLCFTLQCRICMHCIFLIIFFPVFEHLLHFLIIFSHFFTFIAYFLPLFKVCLGHTGSAYFYFKNERLAEKKIPFWDPFFWLNLFGEMWHEGRKGGITFVRTCLD